jgi:hypothetical protein
VCFAVICSLPTKFISTSRKRAVCRHTIISFSNFLSPIDHTIFAYPPRTHVERPDQILKHRLALYGAKQSSALFYKLLHEFLLTLGFVSSTMDPCFCFYKRDDTMIIVHVDNMRVSASLDVLTTIHFALFERFHITPTGDGSLPFLEHGRDL